jgi:hypothetical protein
VAALKEITLDALEFSIRGYFDRRGGRVDGVLNRGFEEIRYETRIESPEPVERIKALVAEAEGHCYVLHTLRRAVRLSARIVLNGALLIEFTHPQD